MLGREDTEGPEGNLISSKLTPLRLFHGSSVAQTAKNLLAMRETQIQALGQEDCLEKEKQPIPVFLSGECHGQRSPYGLHSTWLQRVGHN